MDSFYRQGYLDYYKGISFEECPYPINTAEREMWEYGWNESKESDNQY